MGSHRNVGLHHVSILDDHDHVTGTKIRFSSEAASEHQVVAGVALQLFTLGIPCVYYGTEQALGGPEDSQRGYLPAWKAWSNWADRYLRETMFGPLHPRQRPDQGLAAQLNQRDGSLPGFGPFGTAGRHCFDPNSPAFVRIAALTAFAKAIPSALRRSPVPAPHLELPGPLRAAGPGELIAWSRLLDRREMLCVINGHGSQQRGGDVLIDSDLSPPNRHLQVLVNTAHVAQGSGYQGAHLSGSTLPVLRRDDGTAYVEIRDVGPSEVLVLTNRP